jgi:hypothetical protein
VSTLGECKNCGAVLAGRYCGACGQAAEVGIPSVPALIGEFFESLLHVDSRVWRSLLLLLFRPGRLTNEYLAGRRARYLPPFRLYIVVTLTFFLLVSILPGGAEPRTESPNVGAEPESEAPLPEGGGEAAVRAAGDAPVQSDDAPRGFSIQFDNDANSGWRCDTGDIERLSPDMRARFQEACEKIEADSGASFGGAFLDNIPLMMFFFIPIVALIMKALYPLARRKYVEHLLFFVHFHAFFFLLAAIALLLGAVADLVPILDLPVTLVQFAAWIYVAVYLFLAMRRVYGQGRLATSVKYVLLGIAYFASLTATLLGVLIYTALTL